MRKMAKQNNETMGNLIRAILSSEVKFIVAVIGFVIGVVSPYYQMKQDVSLIQASISNINSNHLMHTQDLAQEVKDVVKVIENQQNQINNLQTQQAVLLERITK